MEFSKEQMDAIVAGLAPSLDSAIETQIKALDAELRKTTTKSEMLFGPRKVGIEKLEGPAVTGEWFRAFIGAACGRIDRTEAALKMRALSTRSWENYDGSYLSDVRSKAMSEGDDAAGGYLVPTEFIEEVIKRLPELSMLAAHVRIIGVNSNAGTIGTSLAALTTRWGTAENAEPTNTDLVTGQDTYTAHNLALLTKISEQLAEDSPIGIANLVTERFADAMSDERDKMIAVGSGTSQPTGISSASITQSVSVGTLSYAKLGSIVFALGANYAARGRWIMNRATQGRCFGLLDTAGQPIFKMGDGQGLPSMLMGYPVSTQPDLPTTSIWFGDLSRGYAIFDRKVLTIRSDNAGTHFDASQIAIKAQQRYDGKVVDVSAFAVGNNITA